MAIESVKSVLAGQCVGSDGEIESPWSLQSAVESPISPDPRIPPASLHSQWVRKVRWKTPKKKGSRRAGEQTKAYQQENVHKTPTDKAD